jgi:sirohydrochlorin cobaltochelatase
VRASAILDALHVWLEPDGARMGELLIVPESGAWTLRHYRDAETQELTLYTRPTDARELARYNAAGEYRPLKSAPTLRSGWLLRLPSISEVRLALDFFYPAMLGTVLVAQEKIEPTSFRATAGRQSGMYAVTGKMPADQADSLIGRFCQSGGGCLKTILWEIDRGVPVTSLPPSKFDLAADQTGVRSSLPFIPLPCAQPCHLLIAAARAELKRRP